MNDTKCYFCDSLITEGTIEEDGLAYCSKCDNGPLCSDCLSEQQTEDGDFICIECEVVEED